MLSGSHASQDVTGTGWSTETAILGYYVLLVVLCDKTLKNSQFLELELGLEKSNESSFTALPSETRRTHARLQLPARLPCKVRLPPCGPRPSFASCAAFLNRVLRVHSRRLPLRFLRVLSPSSARRQPVRDLVEKLGKRNRRLELEKLRRVYFRCLRVVPGVLAPSPRVVLVELRVVNRLPPG